MTVSPQHPGIAPETLPEEFIPERFRSEAYTSVIDPDIAAETLRIDSSALEAMRQQAEEGYPHEICGLLIGRIDPQGWIVTEARAVKNLNQERAGDRFELDPAAYQRIDRELRGSGLEIIGVYHSHPDCPARPSPTDLGHAWEGFAYPIISVCEARVREIRCWRLEGQRFMQVPILPAASE